MMRVVRATHVQAWALQLNGRGTFYRQLEPKTHLRFGDLFVVH